MPTLILSLLMGDNLYNRGEQLQLNCSSEGGPVLEYTWLLSGNIIPNANTDTLTIDNVNTTHAGDYTLIMLELMMTLLLFIVSYHTAIE